MSNRAKCNGALRLGSKDRMAHTFLRINVWVARKLRDLSSARAISEYLGDESDSQ